MGIIKKIQRSWKVSCTFLVFCGFSTLGFASSHSVLLQSLVNKDLIIEDLLQKALDPTVEDYIPEEYVTQEPQENAYKKLSELTSQDKYILISNFVQNSFIPILPQVPSILPNGNLDTTQPASPLSILLGPSPLVSENTSPTSEKQIRVSVDRGLINVSSKSVDFTLGEKASFFVPQADNNISLFVRDTSLVRWDDKNKILSAQQIEGSTELYLHYKDQLVIIPVHVGAGAPHLEMPKSMLVLNRMSESKPVLASLDDVLNTPTTTKKTDIIKNEKDTSQISMTQTSLASFSFVNDPMAFEKQLVEFKIVDDRTDEKNQKIFPIPGVKVQLIGSEITKISEADGSVSGISVPKSSNFMVRVEDPHHRFRATTLSISPIKGEESKPIFIKLLRQDAYEAYVRLTQTESIKDSSSVCATVRDREGKALSGLAVHLDWSKSKALYFNSYQYPDPQVSRTSTDGKFCFFGLEPGPYAFYFQKENGEEEGPIPLPLFRNAHIEHDFKLGERIDMYTALAAAPTAFEVLRGRVLEKEFRPIASAAFVGLGSPKQTWEEDPQTYLIHANVSAQDGKAYYLSQSPEFQQTLYNHTSVEGEAEEHVTPLFPNGFLEDISMSVNIMRYDNTGTVYVDHGTWESQENLAQHIEVSLLDEDAQPVKEKEHFSSTGSNATLFFNVTPGMYTVLVKTPDGHVIANDTVLVYAETMSYVRTGSPLSRISSKSSDLAQK